MSLNQLDLDEMLKKWQANLEEVYAKKAEKDREFCDHEFVEYVGFTQRYFYCKLCDAKSRDGVWIDSTI